MSKREPQSDTSRIVKNSLLSAAGGYALDDFTQNAILLPAAPPVIPDTKAAEESDQIKTAVFSGEPVTHDTETFSEISLDGPSDTESYPVTSSESQNTTTLTGSNSILDQLPSVASSVFSSFSNILRGNSPGPQEDGVIPPDPQINQSSSLDGLYNFASAPASNPLNTNVAAINAEPIAEPKFYSPNDAKLITPQSTSNLPPNTGANNAYRLSSKKKIYAPLPGLNSGISGQNQNQFPILNPTSAQNDGNIQLQAVEPTHFQPNQEQEQQKQENNKFSFSSIFTAAPKLFQFPGNPMAVQDYGKQSSYQTELTKPFGSEQNYQHDLNISEQPNNQFMLPKPPSISGDSVGHNDFTIQTNQNTAFINPPPPQSAFMSTTNQQQQSNVDITNPGVPIFSAPSFQTTEVPFTQHIGNPAMPQINSQVLSSSFQSGINPVSSIPFSTPFAQNTFPPVPSIAPPAQTFPQSTQSVSSSVQNIPPIPVIPQQIQQIPFSMQPPLPSAQPMPYSVQPTPPLIQSIPTMPTTFSQPAPTQSITPSPQPMPHSFQPTLFSVQPTPAPFQPTQHSTQPTPPPFQPTLAPVQPTPPPFQPTPPPVQPTPPPVQSTPPPVQPIPPPVQSTTPPVQPTPPPVQPTLPPFQPTSFFVQPTTLPSQPLPPSVQQTPPFQPTPFSVQPIPPPVQQAPPFQPTPFAVQPTPTPPPSVQPPPLPFQPIPHSVQPPQPPFQQIPPSVQQTPLTTPFASNTPISTVSSYFIPTAVSADFSNQQTSNNYFSQGAAPIAPDTQPEINNYGFSQPISQSDPGLPPLSNNPPPMGTQRSNYRLRGRPHYKNPVSCYDTTAAALLPETQKPTGIPSNVNIFNPVIENVPTNPSNFFMPSYQPPSMTTTTTTYPSAQFGLPPLPSDPIPPEQIELDNFVNPATVHNRTNYSNQSSSVSLAPVPSDTILKEERTMETSENKSINAQTMEPMKHLTMESEIIEPLTSSENVTDFPQEIKNSNLFEQQSFNPFLLQPQPETVNQLTESFSNSNIEFNIKTNFNEEKSGQQPVLSSFFGSTEKPPITDNVIVSKEIQEIEPLQIETEIPATAQQPRTPNFFIATPSPKSTADSTEWNQSDTVNAKIDTTTTDLPESLNEPQSDVQIQNFFNNPPPLPIAGADDQRFMKSTIDTVDIIDKRLRKINLASSEISVSISSNIVEPPSSAQSEFSESADLTADTSIKSDDFLLRDQDSADPRNFLNSLTSTMATDSTTTTANVVYRPVYKHWFYKKDLSDSKCIWTPFSMQDSMNIDSAGMDDIITTDGGRFDVNKSTKQRMPVYWTAPSNEVKLCSWFYKGIDSKLVPYDESVADVLEEVYKNSSNSGEWHQKLPLGNGETVVFHSASVIVHFLTNEVSDALLNTSVPTSNRPRIVKRGVDEFNIDDGEPEQIDHIMFMVHGIGSVCDLKFRPVEEVVEEFRCISLQLTQSHYRSSCDRGEVGRVEILPISWHSKLHSAESGIDEKLKSITLESITKLRAFTNDTLLDILFYTSPTYCQQIIDTVAGSINELYAKFRQRNPTFHGDVSLCGHSLGSLILFDLLQHQKANDDTNSSNDTENSVEKLSNYTVGKAGTGQPFIKYPQLTFKPKKFFALGSPIGMFVTVRGIDNLGLNFQLPTTEGFYNIFHPFDPVAYRIEALINPDLAQLRPVLIPHHKGRKRMHLELRETVARVGADIKQKILDTYKTTMNTVFNFTSLHKNDPKAIQQEVDKVLDEQLNFDKNRELNTSSTTSSEIDNGETDIPLGCLNQGKRMDYVLQEAPLESFNEYLFAMTSHVCYWESEDTTLFIIKEIYSSLGIRTDNQIPQQSLTIERPIQVSGNSEPDS